MSDKNMDDLLAQLKAEFEPEPQPKSKINQSPPQTSAPKVSMAHMLDELRQELESGRDRELSSPSSAATLGQPSSLSQKEAALARQRLNTLIDEDYQAQAQKREAKLVELKKQAEAKLAAEKHRQQELIELQQREELRERRRQEALREKAQIWLTKLNPRSEEGKWFEEFSYSYENKLQAAIDYLEAMRETGL